MGEVAAVGRSAIRRVFFNVAHFVCMVGLARLKLCNNVATTGQAWRHLAGCILTVYMTSISMPGSSACQHVSPTCPPSTYMSFCHSCSLPRFVHPLILLVVSVLHEYCCVITRCNWSHPGQWRQTFTTFSLSVTNQCGWAFSSCMGADSALQSAGSVRAQAYACRLLCTA